MSCVTEWTDNNYEISGIKYMYVTVIIMMCLYLFFVVWIFFAAKPNATCTDTDNLSYGQLMCLSFISKCDCNTKLQFRLLVFCMCGDETAFQNGGGCKDLKMLHIRKFCNSFWTEKTVATLFTKLVMTALFETTLFEPFTNLQLTRVVR